MPNKIKIAYYKTPAGELILGSFEGKLCLCDWRYRKMRNSIDSRIQKGLNAEFNEEDCEVLKKTKRQLTEFFNKERINFDLPLLFVGTDFQKTVWNSLLKIPFGKTETYLGLSKILGNPKAIRAVATANGANAISILVPCHRIIGTNGDLVGYAGGLPAKKKLLGIENPLFNNQIELF
jgi:methylated-DNA-[protein]-cysteine S-methyltransferase